jgi:hypothetical protein
MNTPKYWIFRVGDGENFRNSKFPFWGVKRGPNDCIKAIVKKMKKGDICWFMTSKCYGGKIIGMSEYTEFYDKKDEPLIQVNTFSNDEQNWKGDGLWDIQIHYKNLYNTEKINITGCIKCSAIIFDYDKVVSKINGNLYEHYKNFKLYGEPKIY